MALLESQGINKIVVLGHGGLAADREICRRVPGVDVVLGGYSHALQFNGRPPTLEEAVGPYPEVVNRTGGSPCLIAHAGSYGKYLGLLKVRGPHLKCLN